MSLFRNLAFACLVMLGSLSLDAGCGGGSAAPADATVSDATVDRVDSARPADAALDRAAASDGSVDKPDVTTTSPDAAVDVKDAATAMPEVIPPTIDAAAPVEVAPSVDMAPLPVDMAPPLATDAAGPWMPHPSAMSVAVYDEATLVDFYLTFPAGEWNRLLTLTGAAETRWVTCTVAGFGTPVTPAACRRKGDPLDWARERKPQIVVRFNRTDKNARFRGLRRLNFEAFDGAAAPIRDRIGMWVMREAGIDAPRVNNARVFRDGQLLGVYLNIEAEDKEFLEDHFGPDATGNLWEDGFQLKTNEDMPNSSRLDALNALVSAEPLTGNHTAFYAALSTRMDVTEVLREMAGETALIADDNFSNGSTNYAYYEHPKRGFLVLPWDFDTVITNGPPTADLYDYRGFSDEPNKLRLLMNQNPVWKKQFEDFLVQIRDQQLTRIPAKVDEICNQIREAVRTDPNRSASFEAFEADCVLVKQRAMQRVAAIKQILNR